MDSRIGACSCNTADEGRIYEGWWVTARTLTVVPKSVHKSVLCQRSSMSWTYLSARRLTERRELTVLLVAEGKGTREGWSCAIDGHKKSGGTVGRGTGLPWTVRGAAAMQARAERRAMEGVGIDEDGDGDGNEEDEIKRESGS